MGPCATLAVMRSSTRSSASRSLLVWALGAILCGGTGVLAQVPTPRALADSAYALLEVDPERAMQLALRALPAARKAQDDVLLHDVLNNIRYVHYVRGQHADLLERSVEALSVAERMGNHRTIGDDHGWISVALFGSGQDERGYEHARIALEHMRASGDTAAITRGLSDMANACNLLEKRGEAILHISEAIRLYEATGDSSGAAFAQNMLAAYHMAAKRWSSALPFLHKAHHYIARKGTEVERLWVEGDLARAHLHVGHFDKARAFLTSADARVARLGAARERPRLLHTWVAFHREQRQYDEALQKAMELVELNDSLFKSEAPDRIARSTAAHELARANERAGELKAERDQAQAAAIGLVRWRSGLLTVLGALLLCLLGAVVLWRRAAEERSRLRAELDRALEEVDVLRGHRLRPTDEAPLRKVD